MSGVQGGHRLLNHSRFPAFRKYRRSVRCRAQPLYLLTPAGRFGPSAQQPTGLTLPSGALMVSLPSQISAFCALAARSPCICSFANIGVLRADRAQPLYLLTPSGRFAAFGGNSPQG